MLFGVLNISKPTGMTSRDVVNRVVRRCPRKTKVGHAGTLDPLATGVLVVAVGPATKLIQFSQEATKTYVGRFQLGVVSDTEDVTGDVKELEDAKEVTQNELEKALIGFHGVIQQTPPQYSAVKVNGQRAYKLARQGKTAAIESRSARIDMIELLEFDFPFFSLRIECGKGTYIRTLARDIAKSVGSDAVMTRLERTGVGTFNLDASHELEAIENTNIASLLSSPLQMVSSLQQVHLQDDSIEMLRHGKPLGCLNWNISNSVNELAGVNSSGELMAVLERRSNELFATKVNFVPQLLDH